MVCYPVNSYENDGSKIVGIDDITIQSNDDQGNPSPTRTSLKVQNLSLTRGKIMDFLDLKNFNKVKKEIKNSVLTLKPFDYLGYQSYDITLDGKATHFYPNPSPPGKKQ